MDPDACLQRWRNAVANDENETAKWCKIDLVRWIKNGGFEPEWANDDERSEFISG